MAQSDSLDRRDRFSPHLLKIARLLDKPTPQNLQLAQAELRRLATG